MGMLIELLAAEGLNKGRHKGGQTRQHLAEDLGVHLTFRQQLLLSSGVSRFHLHAPSVPRLWTYNSRRTSIYKDLEQVNSSLTVELLGWSAACCPPPGVVDGATEPDDATLPVAGGTK